MIRFVNKATGEVKFIEREDGTLLEVNDPELAQKLKELKQSKKPPTPDQPSEEQQ